MVKLLLRAIRCCSIFKPFYRFDSEDKERQHGDIRELLWLHVADDWELRTGLGKVFWGVTESQHLVDVINQTDRVEMVDGEQKLGQPMVHLSVLKDWGTIDAFVLPGFRQSNFPSVKGRFNAPLPVDDSHAEFESSAGSGHVDFALRWSHSIEDWDVGLSYFRGTNRDAELVPTQLEGQLQLTPYYAQMDQFGLDAQMTIESWLYKLEATYRDTKRLNANARASFVSLTAGFEYTMVGVWDSVIDLGLLAEYQFDQRDEGLVVPGQNDLFLGGRIGFNNEAGSELLFGLVQDLDHSHSRSGLLEASSRINDNWKWRIDAWFFQSEQVDEAIYSIRQDDFVQLSLEYYF